MGRRKGRYGTSKYAGHLKGASSRKQAETIAKEKRRNYQKVTIIDKTGTKGKPYSVYYAKKKK